MKRIESLNLMKRNEKDFLGVEICLKLKMISEIGNVNTVKL